MDPTMSQFWTEALKQAPLLCISAAVAIWMVNRFLVHINKRDALFADALKEIDRDCHAFGVQREERMLDFLERTRKSLDANTIVLSKVTERLRT